jgi:hypothetical protein
MYVRMCTNVPIHSHMPYDAWVYTLYVYYTVGVILALFGVRLEAGTPPLLIFELGLVNCFELLMGSCALLITVRPVLTVSTRFYTLRYADLCTSLLLRAAHGLLRPAENSPAGAHGEFPYRYFKIRSSLYLSQLLLAWAAAPCLNRCGRCSRRPLVLTNTHHLSVLVNKRQVPLSTRSRSVRSRAEKQADSCVRKYMEFQVMWSMLA